MSERPRPPRARQPTFFLDDFYQNASEENDASPPGSTGEHGGSGAVSSADYYRSVAPAGASAIPRGAGNRSSARATGVNLRAGSGHDHSPPDAPSPRSSFSEEHLQLRHAPVAHPVPLAASHGSRASMAGSWANMPAPPGERDSFFAPPAMPWVRAETPSSAPSRSASPPYLNGGHRTSSAGPMPYYPPSIAASNGPYSAAASTFVRSKKVFTSNLLTGPVEKPWIGKKDIWATLSWWTVVALFIVGVGASAVVCFFAYKDVPRIGKICSILDEDFSSNTLNTAVWNRDVQVSGYGNGEFTWTTTSATNAFIDGGKLYIVPTLTWDQGSGISEAQVLDGYTKTLPDCTNGKPSDGNAYLLGKPTGDQAGLRKRSPAPPAGQSQSQSQSSQSQSQQSQSQSSGTQTASSGQTSQTSAATGGGGQNGVTKPAGGTVGNGGGHDPCTVSSSRAAGTVVNPVQSARLTTRGTRNITYGKVEVTLKLPKGDWLWPRVWLLPENPAYGAWPRSGEIDLLEARGNDPNYKAQGRDYVTSALNWGPSPAFNGFDRTRSWYQQRRTPYSDGFHTFTLEWTKDFLWVFLDRRTQRIIDLRFNGKNSFFNRGHFPLTFLNGTSEQLLSNPWVNRPNSAPFDQPFYLMIDVAAGGTSGFFEDGVGNKPWFDRSATAMRDFASQNGTWYKTWPSNVKDRAMVVDSVKMWKLC